MIANITKGSSFGGCIRYVMGKKGAQLFAATGIFANDVKSIIDSFEFQSGLNPGLKNKVGHISLSFSVKDKDRTDNSFM